MKVSVITPTYNAASTVVRTIDSILQQSYQDIEHIIVDGGSTDQTIEIIEKYSNINWISEKDDGIYDAMNKGISMATGDILAFLNADDYYFNNHIMESVINAFENHRNTDIVYGNAIFEKKGNFVKQRSVPYIKNKRAFHYLPCPHPSSFVKREVFEKIGFYDKEFRIAGDYDFFVRAYLSQYQFFHLDRYCAVFSDGGLSSNEVIRGYWEVAKSQSKNELFSKHYSFFLFLFKSFKYMISSY